MACNRLLDTVGRPKILALFYLFLVCVVPSCISQSTSSSATNEEIRLQEVKKLYDEKNWVAVARIAHGNPDQDADFDFLEGMALSRLQKWQEARDAFSSGYRKRPRESRFLVERAGTEYRLKEHAEAKRDLRSALRLDPTDKYAQEFLGTLYLLDGNLEATLEYWNPLERPRLANSKIDTNISLNQRLLDHAVTFAAPAVLERNALLDSEANLKNLGAFTQLRTEISPATNETYSATIHATGQSGWGSTWTDGAISLLRGLPYQTVYPAYYNFGSEAANFSGLARWDSEKRRVNADFSLPLFHDPAERLRIFVDGRNENWNLSETFRGSATPLKDVNVKRIAAGLELHVVESGRWSWTAGIEGTGRSFENIAQGLPANAARYFSNSGSFDAWFHVEHSLLRIPERRLTLDVASETKFGRFFSNELGAFGTLGGSARLHWLPKARGDDFETIVHVRAANTFGDVPLDELFQLGVERDNDLWLRGHSGLLDGRKGRAPLGQRYVLLNSEINKTIYDGAFFRVQCGPFLDSGSIADPAGYFGSQKWLWDAGGQVKIRVLGSVTVVLSYGRDLRNGTGTFFGTSLR